MNKTTNHDNHVHLRQNPSECQFWDVEPQVLSLLQDRMLLIVPDTFEATLVMAVFILEALHGVLSIWEFTFVAVERTWCKPSSTAAPAPARLRTQFGTGPTPNCLQNSEQKWQQLHRKRS